MQQQILVVEDDPAIRQGIVDALQFEGYETLEAQNGDVGLEMAVKVGYDLLLLDLVLPGRDVGMLEAADLGHLFEEGRETADSESTGVDQHDLAGGALRSPEEVVVVAGAGTGQAEGGEILASDVVRQLVAGKGFLFSDRGERALRGFEDSVRLYEVRWEA